METKDEDIKVYCCAPLGEPGRAAPDPPGPLPGSDGRVTVE